MFYSFSLYLVFCKGEVVKKSFIATEKVTGVTALVMQIVTQLLFLAFFSIELSGFILLLFIDYMCVCLIANVWCSLTF